MKLSIIVLGLMVLTATLNLIIDDEKVSELLNSYSHTLFIVFMVLNSGEWIKATLDLYYTQTNRRLNEQQIALEKIRMKLHENRNN